MWETVFFCTCYENLTIVGFHIYSFTRLGFSIVNQYLKINLSIINYLISISTYTLYTLTPKHNITLSGILSTIKKMKYILIFLTFYNTTAMHYATRKLVFITLSVNLPQLNDDNFQVYKFTILYYHLKVFNLHNYKYFL